MRYIYQHEQESVHFVRENCYTYRSKI